MLVQVLHCVLYPRLEYDLPILSVDMVGSAATGRITLAIADPCPAAMDRSLPPAYAETVRWTSTPFHFPASYFGPKEWVESNIFLVGC